MGSCFAIVQPDEIAALEWMGKFRRILSPGPNCFLPFSTVLKLSARVMENKIVCETKTKDNVFVHIHIAVQQEVRKEKAFEAFYKMSDPSMQIESFVSDVVRSHAPGETLDELFVEKEKIALDVKSRLTDVMNAYGYNIINVLVTDIVPAQEVKDAMNAINTNQRLLEAAREKAEANKIIVVKAAQAEAESKFLQGQGIARSRAAIVSGLRTAVAGEGHEGSLKPKQITELLLATQYLDTMERVAQNPATTIFVPSAAGDMVSQVRAGVLQANGTK
eukprot:TRINITY_DN1283_c0_g1_i3.p1 TRINITY_DN1283_c0_g1~~TRINITY_DN1283_c0_g1_i3.p1  ORF type:complete len:276 (+),score=54.83 TRINITY_DN1283_c0_g1_i3:86-913(+)